MSHKLEIHCCKPMTAKEGNTIRAIVPDDTLEELHRLSEATGYPMSRLARLLIEHALPQVVVIE